MFKVNGSKIEFNGSQNEKDGLVVKMLGSYKHEHAFAQGSVAYPTAQNTKTPTKLLGDFVLQLPQIKGLLFGVNVAANVEKSKTKINYEATLGYSHKDYQVLARSSKNIYDGQSFWGFSFFHNVAEKNFKWGLDFDAEASHSWHRGPIVKIGGEHLVKDGPTVKARALLKWPTPGMYNPETRLAISSKKRFTEHFTATLGFDFNVRQLLGDPVGDVHSVGLDFKIDV